MLVSQARVVRKSSHRLLPEPTKCSTPDFLLHVVFPLTFAIWLLLQLLYATLIKIGKTQLLTEFWTPPKATEAIIPSVHTTAERVWDNTTSCTMSHSRTTVAQIGYLSSLWLPIVAGLDWLGQWQSIRKCLNIERKVILPSFKIYSGRYEEDKLQQRSTQITRRHLISHSKTGFAMKDWDLSTLTCSKSRFSFNCVFHYSLSVAELVQSAQAETWDFWNIVNTDVASQPQ